jgi:hypothetical protein
LRNTNGDETPAINHRLEVTFGSRNGTRGIVPIPERGPGICSVVPFLEKSPSDGARIELWIENLRSSAEKLYAEAGEEVSVFCLLYCNATYTDCSHHDDIDLTSSFLHSMLSDKRPALSSDNITTSVAATHDEMKSREPTEEEWENVTYCAVA